MNKVGKLTALTNLLPHSEYTHPRSLVWRTPPFEGGELYAKPSKLLFAILSETKNLGGTKTWLNFICKRLTSNQNLPEISRGWNKDFAHYVENCKG